MTKGCLQRFIFCCFFALGLTFSLALFAQATRKTIVTKSVKKVATKVEPIDIGEQVPDILFENVLNYKKKSVKLSEFNGKLVILDMWSTTCASCIGAFPKVEKLQDEFKDKVQILLVNPHTSKFDSEARIKVVLQGVKNRTGYYPNLPIPIHDSILNSYFPHKTVPNYIWIDADRKLLAISRASDLTKENINAFLAGEKVKISRKDDWAYDRDVPLLVEGNGGENEDFMYRTIFTGYREGIGFASGIRIDNGDNVIGVYMLNKPLRQYITEAFPDILNSATTSRVILNVNNPARFEWDPSTESQYCYDISLPPTPREKFNVSRFLQEDLKRYFNISVFKERRKTKCLIVTTSANFSNQPSKYSRADILLDSYSKNKFIRHFSISDIIRALDQSAMPLIDETGVSNLLFDIEFSNDFDIRNSASIINELKKAGFEVKEEEREIDMVIITDK